MPMRRYLVELLISMLSYIVAIAVSVLLLRQASASNAVRAIEALLPMLPAAFVCYVIIRQIRRVDELERKVQFEAIAFSFTVTALLTFSYGFLELVGWPKISMFCVWSIMGPLWAIGRLIAVRRYR